jgi:hypothetical protein
MNSQLEKTQPVSASFPTQTNPTTRHTEVVSNELYRHYDPRITAMVNSLAVRQLHQKINRSGGSTMLENMRIRSGHNRLHFPRSSVLPGWGFFCFTAK